MAVVRFLKTTSRQRAGSTETFQQGKVVVLRDDVADHYVRRGLAVIHNGEAPAAAPIEPVQAGDPVDGAGNEGGEGDGDAVGGSADVGGDDGGDSGQRAEPAREPSRRRQPAQKTARKRASPKK